MWQKGDGVSLEGETTWMGLHFIWYSKDLQRACVSTGCKKESDKMTGGRLNLPFVYFFSP